MPRLFTLMYWGITVLSILLALYSIKSGNVLFAIAFFGVAIFVIFSQTALPRIVDKEKPLDEIIGDYIGWLGQNMRITINEFRLYPRPHFDDATQVWKISLEVRTPQGNKRWHMFSATKLGELRTASGSWTDEIEEAIAFVYPEPMPKPKIPPAGLEQSKQYLEERFGELFREAGYRVEKEETGMEGTE